MKPFDYDRMLMIGFAGRKKRTELRGIQVVIIAQETNKRHFENL